jgi:ariadne-1
MNIETEYYHYEDNYNYNFDNEPFEQQFSSELTTMDSMKLYSYTVLTDDELSNQREWLIDKAVEFTGLDRDNAIHALVDFKWDWTRLEQEWYNSPEEFEEKIGIKQSTHCPELTRQLSGKDYCLLCFTPCLAYVTISCGHTFCQACWNVYLKSKLDNMRTLLLTTCPQSNCNVRVPESVFLSHFINDDKIIFYLQVAIKKNFLEHNSEVKNCPTCLANIKCDSKSNVEIDCICGTTFCLKCLKDAHKPCSCEMMAEWEALTKQINQISVESFMILKNCPQCDEVVMNGPCLEFVICWNCEFKFCWLCLIPFQIYNTCDKYKNFNINNKQENRVAVENSKFGEFHEKVSSLNIAAEKVVAMKLEIDGFESNLNVFKMVPNEELVFIRESLEVFIRGLRLLKNSYIFKYFLYETSLFELKQGLLEKTVNDLGQVFNLDRFRDLIKMDNYESFGKMFIEFRSNVINFSKALSCFADNFMNECEGNFYEWVDNGLLEHHF